MGLHISSTANPRVKQLLALRSRRERDASGLFVIEGRREVERAVESGVEVVGVFARAGEAATVPATDAPAVELAGPVFARVAYRDTPGNVVAVARQYPVGLDRFRPGTEPLVLVAAGVEKPGNLGAMMRAAAACGAGVVVADPTTDLFNPNTVRSSLGAVFLVPVAVATAEAVRTWLDEQRIPWWAASQHGAVALWDADLRGPVAVVVGGEAHGLESDWLTDPARTLVIPTRGAVASLNTAAAAAVLLFEAMRQRSRG